jgi:hypothetical protein
VNNGGSDDEIREVRIIGHRLKNPPVTHLTKTSKTAVSIAERLGKSRQGKPVRAVYSTPSTNIRL